MWPEPALVSTNSPALIFAPGTVPTVSVVVPCYNARRWIGETLASTRQRCPFPVELIVVDDGSTDGSGEIVVRDFPEARLVCTQNRGCSAARSLGLEQARGEFVKFLDADDVLLPGMVARQVSLAQTTGADVIYGNWQRLEMRSGAWTPTSEVCRRIEEVDQDVPIAFFQGMWCPTGAYLWRKAFLRERHPGWHPHLPVIQDARYPLDAAMVGANFGHDVEVGVLYRVHGSGSVSTRSREAFLRDCWMNIQDVADKWRAESKIPRREQVIRNAATGILRAAYREAPSLFDELWAGWPTFTGRRLPEGHACFRFLCRLVGYPRAEHIIADIRHLLNFKRIPTRRSPDVGQTQS